jgi:hypothetical protein
VPSGDSSQQAPASAPTPIPAGTVAVAQTGQPAANKAIEVRVTNMRTAPAVGGATAEQGREFVIVDSAWKNLLPLVPVNRKKAQDRTAGMGALGMGGGATAEDKAKDAANTTMEPMKFEIGPMPKHVWLVADGFAEEIDVPATNATDGHLPTGTLGIPALNDVRSGSLVYQARANAQALSLLVLDSANGHLLVPIKGAPAALASSLGGTSRANEFVDLALTGATWADPPADAPGMKTLVVGLKGISRQNAIVDVPFAEFGFLQTDQGCIAQPDDHSPAVTRSLAPTGRFPPFAPSAGQLAFTVPADTRSAALLIRLQQGGPIDLAVLGDGKPRWPSPDATITDGDILRVLKLPGYAAPAGLPAPASGKERVALDLVVENLRSGSGIELQTSQQFRLVGPDGTRYEPSSDSDNVPCRLTGGAVVPAGGARRFTLVYDVPPGQALQFEYRGFEVKSKLVKVR